MLSARNLIDQRLIERSQLILIGPVEVRSLEIVRSNLQDGTSSGVADVYAVTNKISGLGDASEFYEKPLEVPYVTSLGETHNAHVLDQISFRTGRRMTANDQIRLSFMNLGEDSENSEKPTFGVRPIDHQKRKLPLKSLAQCELSLSGAFSSFGHV